MPLIIIILFFSFIIRRAILGYLISQYFFITQILSRGSLDGFSFWQAGAGPRCQFKLITRVTRCCSLIYWCCVLLFDHLVFGSDLSVNLLYDGLGDFINLLLHLRFHHRWRIFLRLTLFFKETPGTKLLHSLSFCQLFWVLVNLLMPVLLDMFA